MWDMSDKRAKVHSKRVALESSLPGRGVVSSGSASEKFSWWYDSWARGLVRGWSEQMRSVCAALAVHQRHPW